MDQRSDLDELRNQFPAWRFGSVWATAASGPDVRRLWATRDGITVSAWDAAALAADIRREDQAAP